ncbi:MAG: hypothetical protein ACX931_03935 [Saccharospirillum sp.]
MPQYRIVDVIDQPQTEAGLITYNISLTDSDGHITTTRITAPPGQFRAMVAAQYPDAIITYSFDTSTLDEFLDPEQDQ